MRVKEAMLWMFAFRRGLRTKHKKTTPASKETRDLTAIDAPSAAEHREPASSRRTERPALDI